MTRSILDWIETRQRVKDSDVVLTKEEFARIRSEGTEEELQEFLDAMTANGGYENLG